jgi:hypothetical protein
MRRRLAGTKGPDTKLRAIRRVLGAILLLGFLITGTDLLLLGHYEDAKQVIPLVLIAMGVLVLVWHAFYGGTASVRALQVTMVLFIASGMLGVVLHYRSNMEFQLEMDSSISGLNLFWKVMQAKAPPALAPSAMAQLGLLGLAYAYRHPALAGSSGESNHDHGSVT